MLAVAIIIVIVIIVVVYIMVNRAANGGGGGGGDGDSKEGDNPARRRRGLLQRSAVDDVQMNVPRDVVKFVGATPLSRVYGQSKIVVPNSEYDPDAEPLPAIGGSGHAHARALSPEAAGKLRSHVVDPHGLQGRDASDVLTKVSSHIVDPHGVPARGEVRARRVSPKQLRKLRSKLIAPVQVFGN